MIVDDKEQILQKHCYTELGRGGLWLVKISPETNYGYYDHDVHGEGGGLWFKDKGLTDFDGRSFLPRDVAKAIIELGYTVNPVNYVGEPL